MICIVDDSNKIINIISNETPILPNERQHYPWNKLWEQYTDTEPLEHAKTRKVTELKKIRDSSEVAPISYKDKLFDYDAKARERMRIAEKALVDTGTTEQAWTCADNTITTLTFADFKNINTLSAVRSGELHVKYNLLKARISGCTSIAEVEAIEWI